MTSCPAEIVQTEAIKVHYKPCTFLTFPRHLSQPRAHHVVQEVHEILLFLRWYSSVFVLAEREQKNWMEIEKKYALYANMHTIQQPFCMFLPGAPS